MSSTFVASQDAPQPASSVETAVAPTTWIIPVPPTLTVVEAVAFEQQVQAHCQQQPPPQTLVIDLSETTLVDSSGIGALVLSHRACQQRQIAMVLRGVREQVQMVLTITDLDQLFTIEAEPGESAQAEPTTVNLVDITTHPSVHSWGKRAMDIVGSLVGLVLTALLALPIGLAIALEDGGPILFKQVRCSWLGQRFYIWKFRTMVINAEALKAEVTNEVEGPLFKNGNDPRITRVGRFLRRTSLDELPQFWNVLVGEMSLVGTRPPTPDEIDQYNVPEWQRLNVRPGMTGEWQVNGRSSVKKFEDVIRMDLTYQKNWSLLYDIKLILKTIQVLFSKHTGAA